MNTRVMNSSHDHHNKPTNLFSTNKKPTSSSIWSTFQRTSSSGFYPMSFLKDIGTKMGSALSFFSNRKRYNSHKVVSSTSLARSSSYAERFDSQRAEAIEDCIHFLNLNSSSNSLQRSNSVSWGCDEVARDQGVR